MSTSKGTSYRFTSQSGNERAKCPRGVKAIQRANKYLYALKLFAASISG